MGSNGSKVFLKQNVVVEPLFNQWYAWPYLIAPAAAAMFTANWHMKIMQSFVSSPQVHIAALKNPAMLGGPFLNYDASRVPDINNLMKTTSKLCAPLLGFADAVKACDEMLKREANGCSLESHYAKVPELLKGYVELTYDLNHNASLRFIEPLLYKSRYYDESAQSVMLSLVDKDERSFVFSTPRLPDEQRLHLHRPFRDPAFDELFRLKREPQPYDYIKEVFGITGEDEALFSSFFTHEAPGDAVKCNDEGMVVRYLGHACILVESEEISILCDPVISYRDSTDDGRYTYCDLPDVLDYVLITHNHADHCMFETLLQLRHKIKQIIVPRNNGGSLVDPSLKLVLQNIGFDNVSEIDEMESIPVPGGSITGLPFLGEHADLNIRSKTAHLINLHGKSVLCAADSNNIEPRLYQHVHEIVGDVDLLFLGMECDGAPLSWLYGPLLTAPVSRTVDQSRRLDGSNFERGMSIVEQLNPKQVYVYAMGLEPWLTYLTSIQYTDQSRPIIESSKLVDECRRRGLVAERLFGQKDIYLPAA